MNIYMQTLYKYVHVEYVAYDKIARLKEMDGNHIINGYQNAHNL